MDEPERKREARRQRRLERLGTATPRCVVCGMEDDRCLEAHHIAGRNFDDTTAIQCRNCHRILSDELLDHPSAASDPPSLHDCVGHFLKGLAALLVMLAAKLNEFGDALIAFAMSEAASAAGGAQ